MKTAQALSFKDLAGRYPDARLSAESLIPTRGFEFLFIITLTFGSRRPFLAARPLNLSTYG
jgi:hypothetical protein